MTYTWVDASLTTLANCPAWLSHVKKPRPVGAKFTLPLDADGMIPRGQQDDTLLRLACSLRAQGFEEPEIIAALEEALKKCPQDPAHPFTAQDMTRWLQSSARYDQGQGATKLAKDQAARALERAHKAEAKATAASAKAARIAQLEAKGLLYNTHTGMLVSAQTNVIALLSVKYPGQFWRNEFTQRDHFNQAELTDELVNRLHTELETDQRAVFRREHLEHGISDLCASTKRHPIRDWLAGLVWDQQPRLTTLAADVFRADNPIAAPLVRKWLIAAVARIFDPGCKFDYMLLLIGRQGIYKSTALRVLAGAPFLDHIDDLRDKDTLLKFTRAWICEFQELSALKRSEVEHVKAFITRQYDVYRSPYGRREAIVPRHCVFAATTNDDQPLKEEDENRRFWPVYCREGERLNLDALRADREQLWAEAVASYRGGESLYLQDELLLSELTIQQRDLSAPLSDTWEDQLQPLFKSRTWCFLGELFETLSVPPERQTMSDIIRLSKILKRNGYVRSKKIGGGVHRGKYAWILRDVKDSQPWYDDNASAVEKVPF